MSTIVMPFLGSNARDDDNIHALLRTYPRARPPLSAAHQRIYLDEYRRNRGRHGTMLFRLTGALEQWMHQKVAKTNHGHRILELGAGTLNHMQYQSAELYDIVEPLPALYADNPLRQRIAKSFIDIADIPDEKRYDRIISVAVMEHVQDLTRIVARSGLLLEREGVFQAGIPSEGGALWGTAWRLTTGVAYRLRTGLPYAPLMRHEHVNTAAEVIAVIRYFFRFVRLTWFPLSHRHVSFYCYIEARDADPGRCRKWATRAGAPDPTRAFETRR